MKREEREKNQNKTFREKVSNICGVEHTSATASARSLTFNESQFFLAVFLRLRSLIHVLHLLARTHNHMHAEHDNVLRLMWHCVSHSVLVLMIVESYTCMCMRVWLCMCVNKKSHFSLWLFLELECVVRCFGANTSNSPLLCSHYFLWLFSLFYLTYKRTHSTLLVPYKTITRFYKRYKILKLIYRTALKCSLYDFCDGNIVILLCETNNVKTSWSVNDSFLLLLLLLPLLLMFLILWLIRKRYRFLYSTGECLSFGCTYALA